jgi:hypothetical protein
MSYTGNVKRSEGKGKEVEKDTEKTVGRQGGRLSEWREDEK